MNSDVILLGLLLTPLVAASCSSTPNKPNVPTGAGTEGAASSTSCAATSAKASGNKSTADKAGIGIFLDGGSDVAAETLKTYSRVRVMVRVDTMPPSRTACTFDQVDGSDSFTVDWDPLHPGTLVRFVMLQPKKYRVACYADPIRPTIEPKENCAWTFEKAKEIDAAADDFKTGGGDAGTAVDAATGGDASTVAATVGCQDLTKPAATGASVVLKRVPKINILDAPSFLDTSTAAKPVGSPLRTVGGVSAEAVTELLQVISEVVLERVKAAGLRVVQARLADLFCGEDKDHAEIAKKLPRTCAAIRTIRIDDLVAAGHQLLDAIGSDLLAAAPILKNEAITKSSAFLILSEVAADALSRRHDGLRGAGQRVLLRLAQYVQERLQRGGDVAADDANFAAFNVVLATLAECHRSRCGPAQVQDMLTHPDLYFAGSGLKGAADYLHDEWPTAAEFVSRGLRVLTPPPNTTEVELLATAVDLFFEVAALDGWDKSCSHDCTCLTSPRRCFDEAYPATLGAKADPLTSCQRIKLARDFFNAAAHADLPKMMSASAPALAVDSNVSADTIKRLGNLVGTFGAFLDVTTAGEKPTEAQLKARRDARKAAINALIDINQARSERLDATITSFGGALGFGGFSALATKSTTLSPVLTLGVAIDYIHRSRFGVHAEFAPLNFGVAARTKDSGSETPRRLTDIFSPTALIGVSALPKDGGGVVVYLGPTFGFMPQGSDYAAYIGLVLGGYLPIVDFN